MSEIPNVNTEEILNNTNSNTNITNGKKHFTEEVTPEIHNKNEGHEQPHEQHNEKHHEKHHKVSKYRISHDFKPKWMQNIADNKKLVKFFINNKAVVFFQKFIYRLLWAVIYIFFISRSQFSQLGSIGITNNDITAGHYKFLIKL